MQRNSLALRIVLASFPDMRGRAVPPGSFHPCRGFQLVWAGNTAAAHFFRYLKSENPRLVTQDAGDTCNYPPPPCSTDTTPSHQSFLFLGIGVHQTFFCAKYEVSSQHSITSSLFGVSSPIENTKRAGRGVEEMVTYILKYTNTNTNTNVEKWTGL